MEQIEFQEPCCIERNLPRLLTSGKVLVWHTNGDILFSHIMKSLACLAGNALHVTIATPVHEVAMIMEIANDFCTPNFIEALQDIVEADASIAEKPVGE